MFRCICGSLHAAHGQGLFRGVVVRRWRSAYNGNRCDIELVLMANHVVVHNDQSLYVNVTDELRAEFDRFWEAHRQKPMTGMCSAMIWEPSCSWCPLMQSLKLTGFFYQGRYNLV